MSMFSCILLGHIAQRNQQIHPSARPPFLLVGDPFQIPPTGAEPFYDTMIKLFVDKVKNDPTSPGTMKHILSLKTRMTRVFLPHQKPSVLRSFEKRA